MMMRVLSRRLLRVETYYLIKSLFFFVCFCENKNKKKLE